MPLMLISESQVASKHNAIPNLLCRFSELSPFLQEKCSAYYRHGGVYEGRLNSRSVWPGKKTTAFLKLTEMFHDDDEDNAIDQDDQDIEDALGNRDQVKLGRTDMPAPGVRNYHQDIDELAKSIQTKVIAGDKAARKELFQAFLPYAKAISSHELYFFPEIVDDVASDAMRVLFKKIDENDWDPGTGLMTWVKTIVRNCAMNATAKERRHKGNFVKDEITGVERFVPCSNAVDDTPTEEDHEGDVRYSSAVAADNAPLPGSDLERREEMDYFLQHVRKLMAKLPAEERIALEGVSFEGKSQQEVAKENGWTINQVKGRLENARYWTKEWLKEDPKLRGFFDFILHEGFQGVNLVDGIRQMYYGTKVVA